LVRKRAERTDTTREKNLPILQGFRDRPSARGRELREFEKRTVLRRKGQRGKNIDKRRGVNLNRDKIERRGWDIGGQRKQLVAKNRGRKWRSSARGRPVMGGYRYLNLENCQNWRPARGIEKKMQDELIQWKTL